jgi:hypothetical protein
MRKLMIGLVCAGFVGSAAAGDYGLAEARFADGNDYTARVYYKLDLGAEPGRAHTVGLRFDHDLAAAHGAPALFQASYNGASQPVRLTLQGADLTGPMMASGQFEVRDFITFLIQNPGVLFSGIVATAVITTVVVESTEDDVTTTSGTGGSN